MKIQTLFGILITGLHLISPLKAGEIDLEVPRHEVQNANRYVQEILSTLEEEGPRITINRPAFIDQNRTLKNIYWVNNDIRFISQQQEKSLDTVYVLDGLHKEVASRLAGKNGNTYSVSNRAPTLEERKFIYKRVIDQVLFERGHREALDVLANSGGRYWPGVEYIYLSSRRTPIDARTLRHQGALELVRQAAAFILGNPDGEGGFDIHMEQAVQRVNGLLGARAGGPVQPFTLSSIKGLLNFKAGKKTLNFRSLVQRCRRDYGQEMRWEDLDNGVEVHRRLIKLIHTDGDKVKSTSQDKFIDTPINPVVHEVFVSPRSPDGDCAIHALGLTNYTYKDTHPDSPSSHRAPRASSTRLHVIDEFLADLEDNEEARKTVGKELFKRYWLNLKPEGAGDLDPSLITKIHNRFAELAAQSSGLQDFNSLTEEQTKYEDGRRETPPEYRPAQTLKIPMTLDPRDSESPYYFNFFMEEYLTKKYVIKHYLKECEYLFMGVSEFNSSIADFMAKKNKVLYEFWRDPNYDWRESGYQFFRRGGDLSGSHEKKVMLKHSGIHFDAFVPISSWNYHRSGSSDPRAENYRDPANGSQYVLEKEGYDINALIDSRVHELLFNLVYAARR